MKKAAAVLGISFVLMIGALFVVSEKKENHTGVSVSGNGEIAWMEERLYVPEGQEVKLFDQTGKLIRTAALNTGAEKIYCYKNRLLLYYPSDGISCFDTADGDVLNIQPLFRYDGTVNTIKIYGDKIYFGSGKGIFEYNGELNQLSDISCYDLEVFDTWLCFSSVSVLSPGTLFEPADIQAAYQARREGRDVSAKDSIPAKAAGRIYVMDTQKKTSVAVVEKFGSSLTYYNGSVYFLNSFPERLFAQMEGEDCLLYQYDLSAKELRQASPLQFEKMSGMNGHIFAYEKGGSLYHINLSDHQSKLLSGHVGESRLYLKGKTVKAMEYGKDSFQTVGLAED